ncbi:MAG: hypothetical protein ACT4OZ_03975 [Gemmatimonadota bacterium]
MSALDSLRRELFVLHKSLIESERRRYERDHGRVADGLPLLDLVTRHESFAWLHQLTTLIARIDEATEAREPLSPAISRKLASETSGLIDAGEAVAPEHQEDQSTGPAAFQFNYARVIHSDPEVLFAHARALRALQRMI